MKTRVISGLVLAALIMGFTFIGGLPLWAVSMLIACLGAFELYKISGIYKNRLTWIVYPCIVLLYLLNLRFNLAFTMVLLAVIILLIINTLRFQKTKPSVFFIALMGFFYPGLMSVCFYLCRCQYNGLFLSFLIIVCSWLTDTFAYFVGTRFGKHHPFKTLSPKKSTEGCIGGVLGSTLVCVLCALIFKENVLKTVIIGMIASLFSEIGDLSASAIKRQFNVKDYGQLIPGHGGIMDRFDSMLFVGAIVYICVRFQF